jgi:hypothetical protein
MNQYKEWSKTFNDRTGYMLPVEKFDNIIKFSRDPGYSSLYAFDEVAAKAIISSGVSRGFNQYEAIADHLIVDLDDGMKSLPAVLERFTGLKHEVWSSGGKGFHIYLYHNEIKSIDLPYSHGRWVAERLAGLNYDTSIYRHDRIISLPNRLHPETKKRKSLVSRSDGDLVVIELVKKPEVDFNFEGSEGEIMNALMNLTNLSAREPSIGDRHQKLWGCAKDLIRCGFEPSAVESFLQHINSTWKNQKEAEEISMAVNQALGGLR